MVNEIKMDIKHAIKALYNKGWAQRAIARELNIHRKTVRRHIREVQGEALEPPKGTKVTPGKPGDFLPVSTGTPSRCAPYRAQIETRMDPGINRKSIYDLAAGRYLEQGRDVLFVGPPGVGKSHLAQALGHQAILQGHTVRYRSIFDIVGDLKGAEALDPDNKRITSYLKPDLLIIDDMGIKQLPRHSGEHLFEIIMRRYETRSTIMTSNRPIEEWGKLIGDVPAAGAILDRFLHHAEIIEMTGRSYRLKDRQGGS